MFSQIKNKVLAAGVVLLCGAVGSTELQAQEAEDPVVEIDPGTRYTSHNKGKFYVYWGWNRGFYSRSTIHFKGSDYNFTIHKAKGHDNPSKFNYHNYFQIDRVTIPQTDVRVGYFISDHYNVSFGIDHMKYVMKDGQNAYIDGYIDIAEGSPYNGTYDHQLTWVSDDMLHFEHTDGLNYVNFAIERYDDLGKLLGGKWNMDKFQINGYAGAGLGFLVPKTNATILNRPRHDKFHLSGYGFSVHQGINFTFFKHYFMQIEAKEGFIDMTDARTTFDKSDRASHSFFFVEPTIMFGGIFRL